MLGRDGGRCPSSRTLRTGDSMSTTVETRVEAEPTVRRRRFFRYTLPGAWVALVFTCLAFTPSLLPRGPVTQGVICGITAAIGYGFGVLGAWVWRAVVDRDVRPTGRPSWYVFFGVGAASLLVS